jgi:heme/copper-type cytochrome/quinol oxidase subunit 2
MKRLMLFFAVLAVVLTAAGAGVAAPAKETFQLKGEVYASGFKIELKTAAGRNVKTVRAGTYRIKIEDHSAIHDFHLTGPGVNKKTSVAGRSETIWTVALRAGTYTFRCDAHASMMRGSFRVT